MPANNELLEALDAMKAEKNVENAERLTKLLENTNVLVPAIMPKNTDPAILKEMASHPGKPMPMPQGVHPVPCILNNSEGMKFLPMFTSDEEIEKGQGMPKYPITLNMPFKSCMDLAVKIADIPGAVINPYSHNIIISVNRNSNNSDADEQETKEPKVTKLTEEQFHALVRQQMEIRLLPEKIFKEGEEFINDLTKRKGECLIEFFEKPYAQIECPYSEDDYEFMTLFISDTLQLTRISMPYENLSPGIAQTIFVTWNPEEKKAGYYIILMGARGEFNKLVEITSEGKVVEYGDAPSEGSELQSIIDIANAK